MTITTVREHLASLPERKALVRAVLGPNLRGKRDKTMVSAYKRLRPGPDGRIHTGLSIATTSGRLASSGSIVEEAATNLQNLANKIATMDPLYQSRAVMRADEGFHLVCRDFAGAEMLLAFAYSQDWEWVERMLKGESAHGVHAKEAFGLTCRPEEVKRKHPQVYTTAKNLGFLSLYSGGGRTATVTFNKDFPVHGLRTTEKEVKRFQDVLYSLHRLQDWWREVEEQLERDGGIITTALGYQRPLRDPDHHNRLKDALSLLPQGTVAQRMNESFVTLHDEMDRRGEIELLHQVHDELDWQALPEFLDESLAFSKQVMEKTFKIHGRTLYIPTEVKVGVVGGSWASVQEHKEV